ncbi:MICOS complex subunit mic25a-like isoform X2 [Sardina pilchardus]|uniref:MICOS complex subunit mic25a-like isoform X2 n=1 Tax=Sardina pilchardus TaxID=27697 RepID=UPI002E0DAED4
MGGRESTTRKVSFGLDEEEKVTVLQGIKLSEDVLQRMRDPEPAPAPGVKPPKPESRTGPPPGPSAAQMQDELRRRFEQQQAMVQEELARIARRERDAGDENVGTAVLRERNKTREEQEKAQSLAKQLDKKEAELQQLSAFYKEQLLLLEKKNMDIYQEAADQYNQAASKAEAHIKPRHVVPICPGLQSDVLNCYKENKHQTLLCSSLAKEYMNCINTAKKNTMVNHG